MQKIANRGGKITIFTPTYNRAYTLERLYESLCTQTVHGFEWIIVDDGSTDNTEQLVKRFISESKLTISYIKQPNSGKHCAINRGIEMARGDWFFIVDSDDYLPANSVELILLYVEQITIDESFAGVSGLRCYPNGRKVGGAVTYDVLDTDSVSFRVRYHVRGDMAEIWRTSLLRQYPFPMFRNERFMSEGIVWNAIAKKYKLRYFNKNIYTCDYLPDGLTRNVRRHHRQSPQGSMLVYATISRDARYGLKRRTIAAVNYWRYTICFRGKRCVQLSLWGFILYPLGLFFYCLDLYAERR